MAGNSTRWAECVLWAWSVRGSNSMGWEWPRSSLCEARDIDNGRPMPFSVTALHHVAVEQLPDIKAGVGVPWLSATDCWRADAAWLLHRKATKATEAGNLYHWWIFAAFFVSCWMLSKKFYRLASLTTPRSGIAACQVSAPLLLLLLNEYYCVSL